MAKNVTRNSAMNSGEVEELDEFGELGEFGDLGELRESASLAYPAVGARVQFLY